MHFYIPAFRFFPLLLVDRHGAEIPAIRAMYLQSFINQMKCTHQQISVD